MVDSNGRIDYAAGLAVEVPEITSITSDAYWDLNEKQLGVIRLRVQSSSGIVDAVSLMRRLHEYIHFASLENRPVSLSDVNKRFGRAAKAAGLTCREAVETLSGMDLIRILEGKSQTLLAAEFKMRAMREKFKGKELTEITDRFMSNLRE